MRFHLILSAVALMLFTAFAEAGCRGRGGIFGRRSSASCSGGSCSAQSVGQQPACASGTCSPATYQAFQPSATPSFHSFGGHWQTCNGGSCTVQRVWAPSR